MERYVPWLIVPISISVPCVIFAYLVSYPQNDYIWTNVLAVFGVCFFAGSFLFMYYIAVRKDRRSMVDA